MEELFPFFLILLIGIVSSAIFRRFHLPWVVALIAAGVLVGPHGFAVLDLNPTITFMGEIGLIFLMFMAGLEAKLSSFREFRGGIVGLSLINGLVPLAVGYGIGVLLGFPPLSSIILGLIFVSSSIAVIIPSLEANKLIGTKLGRSIVAATIVEDVTSLVLLSIFLQVFDPVTALPLPVFYVLLAAVLVIFRLALPRIRTLISPIENGETDLFQREVRLIFVILLGTVVAFDFLGLHPIIAGFFAGLVLSDSIKSEIVIDKLRTISYGLFIPIFFVIVGAQTNIAVFSDVGGAITLVAIVVFGSMLSKFVSGWIGGRISGFGNVESTLIGVATIPQLSTTLAVVFTAVELGLLKPELVTAMVILIMVTTMVAPIGIRVLSSRLSISQT